MPSLSTLPIELWLDIIGLLRSSGAPITGVNAGWTKLSNVCPPTSGNVTDLEPWATSNRERNWSLNSALGNLRLTSREMNELCTPFQFQDVNLMEHNPAPEMELPMRHAHHIRSIRIIVDPYDEISVISEQYKENVAKLLLACSNIQSVGLYYRDEETSIARLADEVVQLMRRGTLESLGVYSVLVLHQDVGEWWWSNIFPLCPAQLFVKTLVDEEVTRSLRRLDVVTETMNQDTYDVIRMCFPALESLTIRRGIRSYLGRIWDPTQSHKWYSKPNLTHLHIIDCLAGYAPHIPELVRLFTSLKFLTISTCGNEDDIQPSLRQRGWSTEPGALCRIRRPLESFHIEHMEEWEISALGIIPTKLITLSNITRGHFVRAIERDPELFPHLKTLSVRPIPSLSDADKNDQNETEILAGIEEDKKLKETLDSICKRRGVTIRFDGYCIKPSIGLHGFA